MPVIEKASLTSPGNQVFSPVRRAAANPLTSSSLNESSMAMRSRFLVSSIRYLALSIAAELWLCPIIAISSGLFTWPVTFIPRAAHQVSMSKAPGVLKFLTGLIDVLKRIQSPGDTSL